MQPTAAENSSGYIFISYSKKQGTYARGLADHLVASGFDVWIDDRIEYGSNWWNTIVETIRQSAALVVIMTPDSLASEWVQLEVQLAKKWKKPVFPLLLQGENWPLFELTQYVDVSDQHFPEPDFLDRLADFVPRQVGRAGSAITVDPMQAVTPPRPAQRRITPMAAALVIVAMVVVGAAALTLRQSGGPQTPAPPTTQIVQTESQSTATAYFVPTPLPPALPFVTTPYDGKVAVWFWRSDSIPYTSIDELARGLRETMPAVNTVYVKVADGSNWQGTYERVADFAVNGPADVDRWVETLGQYGLEFHAWAVPKGVDIPAEVDVLVQAASRPGVRSLLLDVEPYDGFWSGTADDIARFMSRFRQSLPDIHIGLAIDPRPWHYQSISPEVWLPYVGSVHPMAFWATFRQTPDEVLKYAYDTWGDYGLPIYPMFTGDSQPVDMQTARDLAVGQYHAAGLSLWRLGTILDENMSVIGATVFAQRVTEVPFIGQLGTGAQRFTYDSGPAVVAMLLKWLGKEADTPKTVDQLAGETALVQTDAPLTTAQVVRLAGNNGIALRLTNDLTLDKVLSELAAGRPPVLRVSTAVLDISAGAVDAFVLVVGYSAEGYYVHLPWLEQGAYVLITAEKLEAAMQQANPANQGALYVPI